MVKRKLALTLLLEDEEEEDFLYSLKRGPTAPIFKKRREEGWYSAARYHFENDEEKFRRFFRLNFEEFNFVVSMVEKDLTKPKTNFVPEPISPREKVAVTLRYLATGETFASLAFTFRISRSYVGEIVKDTLDALCRRLVPIFLPPPTKESLILSAATFGARWNFPNCIAAIDGKHIRIFCPEKSGSLFFNYKDYFSVVLLALVDANYKFLAVDVGSYGKEGDSSIFNKSVFGRTLLDSDFYPPDAALPGSTAILPHVIVGDEAFRLHKHVMKPYDKKSARSDTMKALFNYRLSRARRVSENSFALLSQVWRVFYTHISVKPETAEQLILATCCLHNLLRDHYLESNGHYDNDSSIQTPNFHDLTRSGGFQSLEGFNVRNEFATYFQNEGAVSWQQNRI